jgi:hypothetical protein
MLDPSWKISNAYNLYFFTIMIIHMVNQSDTSNNFAVIFDGNNLKNWQMAGRGKFLVLQEEGALQSEGGMGLLW